MHYRSWLTQELSLTYPILMGGMMGLGRAELVAADLPNCWSS
ncbi:hypothetical protein [Thioclava sp. GXIMD2076]|uniref:Nitronate monooxygenase domain-containing protein n=1 Tax=Thioclava kandeliae TaxID=3070818 RepID=A0ABV1SMH6_9RHOB